MHLAPSQRLATHALATMLAVCLAACTPPESSAAAPVDGAPAASAPSEPASAPVPAAAALDCRKTSTPVDKAICADPALVDLDRTLAQRWTAAMARTDDREALLTDQRDWLATRAECIGMSNQRGCLRAHYAIRNAILEAIDGGFGWAGKWQRISGQAGFELVPDKAQAFAFKIDAAAGGNTGGIEQARATPDGARVLRVVADAATADVPCRLELRRVANQIELMETDSAFDCGAAMDVTYAGRYAREDGKAREVEWNLLTLDLVDTAQAQTRVRALLGEDGTADLIDRCQQVQQDPATPGLSTCGVRGLYTFMEAALEQQGERVRVAQLVGDEVRYWSNDPATQTHPPAWFDDWRKRFADKPVRLMSAAGHPLMTAAARAP